MSAAPTAAAPDPIPEVTVVVHPIDTAVHPLCPPGWRWAVMVGGTRPADLDYCVNAGHCPTESEAALYGEMNGASATKALRLLGIPARYGFLRLGHDPIPAEADDRPLAVWHGEGN